MTDQAAAALQPRPVTTPPNLQSGTASSSSASLQQPSDIRRNSKAELGSAPRGSASSSSAELASPSSQFSNASEPGVGTPAATEREDKQRDSQDAQQAAGPKYEFSWLIQRLGDSTSVEDAIWFIRVAFSDATTLVENSQLDPQQGLGALKQIYEACTKWKKQHSGSTGLDVFMPNLNRFITGLENGIKSAQKNNPDSIRSEISGFVNQHQWHVIECFLSRPELARREDLPATPAHHYSDEPDYQDAKKLFDNAKASHDAIKAINKSQSGGVGVDKKQKKLHETALAEAQKALKAQINQWLATGNPEDFQKAHRIASLVENAGMDIKIETPMAIFQKCYDKARNKDLPVKQQFALLNVTYELAKKIPEPERRQYYFRKVHSSFLKRGQWVGLKLSMRGHGINSDHFKSFQEAASKMRNDPAFKVLTPAQQQKCQLKAINAILVICMDDAPMLYGHKSIAKGWFEEELAKFAQNPLTQIAPENEKLARKLIQICAGNSTRTGFPQTQSMLEAAIPKKK